MAKPPVRRVPSDDCEVTIAGVTYNPHEGEYVEVVGSASIAELKSLWAFDRISVELQAIQGDPDEYEKTTKRLDEYYDDLCAWIARRVVDWDWTDDQGHPLPKPDGSLKPIQALRSDEIYYLRRVLRGESPLVANGDSGTLPTTPSATDSTPTPKEPRLTSGRSRMKS